jgi:hypothetical protein
MAAARPGQERAGTADDLIFFPAMIPHLDRRSFLRTSATLVAGSALISRPLAAQPMTAANPSAPPAGTPPPKPPALAPEKVQATVGQAHRSLENVRKLVEETPLLANSSWDWGGGDFETPLQAAAHTGQREIAEYLLSKGARIEIYAAAMLGQLAFVQAVLALNPKAHEIPGPHGFTLLHCAKQGGAGAQPVVDWLLAHGVPDVTFRPLPYVWPPGPGPKAT